MLRWHGVRHRSASAVQQVEPAAAGRAHGQERRICGVRPGLDLLARDHAQCEAAGKSAHLVEALADAGQARHGERAILLVVESDDREVPWYRDPVVGEGRNQAEGVEVGRGDHSCRSVAGGEERLGRARATGAGEVVAAKNRSSPAGRPCSAIVAR